MGSERGTLVGSTISIGGWHGHQADNWHSSGRVMRGSVLDIMVVVWEARLSTYSNPWSGMIVGAAGGILVTRSN